MGTEAALTPQHASRNAQECKRRNGNTAGEAAHVLNCLRTALPAIDGNCCSISAIAITTAQQPIGINKDGVRSVAIEADFHASVEISSRLHSSRQ